MKGNGKYFINGSASSSPGKKGDSFKNGEAELSNLMPTKKEAELEYVYKEVPYAPEGLWGWIIVAAAFWTNFIVDGISLCYSVMTEELTGGAAHGNDTSTGNQTSEYMTLFQHNLVGSVTLGVTLMMGPLASIIAEKIGFRMTAMCGSIVATVGMLISWGASPDIPSFWAFLIGFGLITGIGFGIMFTLSIVIVGLYFDKNLPLATGITVAGTGVGILFMAPVSNVILGYGGWQGTMWFQTALCAVSVLLATVYKPQPVRLEKLKKAVTKQPRGMPIKQQLVELLTSPSYMLMAVSGVPLMMGYFAPYGFLIDTAAEKILREQAVFLMTILGISNTVCRVASGLLANKIGHSIMISNVALTFGGLVTAYTPYAQTHAEFICCAIGFGMFSAVFASLRSVVIKEITGEEKLNVGFGLSLIFMGIATFASNSFAAHLKEVTENYEASFIVPGAFLVASAVLMYPLPCILRWERRRAEETLEEHQLSSQRRSLVNVNVFD